MDLRKSILKERRKEKYEIIYEIDSIYKSMDIELKGEKNNRSLKIDRKLQNKICLISKISKTIKHKFQRNKVREIVQVAKK
jgi:hypothetical protein